jgi:transposase-like protein
MQEQKPEMWAKWRGLVSEQSGSGQSIATFCKERGLPAWQFFAWKKRLRRAAAGAFLEVQVVREPPQAAAVNSRAIEIHLAEGRRILVEPGFDAGHLRAVVAALETQD